MNNLKINSVLKFVEDAESNPDILKKSKSVEGEWNLEEGNTQFSSEVEFKEGKLVLKSDQPPFMGGNGTAPDPIQYCLFGLTACFAGTFVTIATQQGITLEKFIISAENQVDLGMAVGLSDNPIVERVKISVKVKGDISRDKLSEIEDIVTKRCPGVYCLTNPIPLETSVEVI
ncbi:MAG: OsmC family protein [Nitrospirota bacterium]